MKTGEGRAMKSLDALDGERRGGRSALSGAGKRMVCGARRVWK
jgi:hypothetical protein